LEVRALDRFFESQLRVKSLNVFIEGGFVGQKAGAAGATQFSMINL